MSSERGEEETEARGGVPPWAKSLESVVFAVLETSDPDPAEGQLERVHALRISGAEECEAFETTDASSTTEKLEELGAFCGGQVLVVLDSALLRQWIAAHGGPGETECMGLGELAGLLLPGRLASWPEDLLQELCGSSAPLEAPTPEGLRRALSRLVRRFLSQDRDVIHALSVGLATAWSRLCVTEPTGADALARVLQLLQSASLWLEEEEGEAPVEQLRFESDSLETDFLHLVLEEALPRWTRESKAWHEFKSLSPNREAAMPWTAEDEAMLDVAFREHVPALFEEERAGSVKAVYREGQHEVGREVAKNFGRNVESETQLLLMHAPTGTGKTLAYLIPTMLWARRHEVRVGIATYTRALQEQAIDREVPRALEILKRSGIAPGLRVSMLKGRENYLCWRTLRLHVPPFESSGELWLAFCQLLAFSLSDPSGDLDRLPRRAPINLAHNDTYRATLVDLIRQVRARTSCCRNKDDKHTCGAEVARWRAERSHVVITNHSFALARQEFFRHVVFDECEHLHDQAHSAWSHVVSMKAISTWLDRLYSPDNSRKRSLFKRVAKRIVTGTPSWETLTECKARHEALQAAHDELLDEAKCFDKWRRQQERERDEREEHSLLREYVESDRGRALIRKRLIFTKAGGQLDEQLAELSSRLEALGKGRLARLRRSMDIARTELDEFLLGLHAWLPVQEGKPTFNKRTFNDVGVEPNNGLVLSARVLLPNEYLGRFYYPQLSTASFLSATTFMQGGFDAAASYLGLDRAVAACEDDPDLLCKLHTFRSPEVFDYARALVAVPRDSPSVSRDKDGFLRYVRDFIADLGERTNGRMLVLFTNADDVRRVGERLEGHFRARNIGFWYQNMPGTTKEELGELFRRRVDSVLLGVDTFWYGADFPGETLEHLILVRLPYGVPDRYHHAQCASLGIGEQRRQIYMPRALAKFRQGFGRLMRRVTDRGCIYILDGRVVDPRHRTFLRELPIARIGEEAAGLARMVRGDTERCTTQALIHMGLERGATLLPVQADSSEPIEHFEPRHEAAPSDPDPIDITLEDLPF